MDLSNRKASAAASGIIDGLGYAGASVAGIRTAYVKTNYGWDAAFALWISGAIIAAILMSFLGILKPKKIKNIIRTYTSLPIRLKNIIYEIKQTI